MKKLLSAALLAVTFAGAAHGADLPGMKDNTVVINGKVVNWSGIWGGGQVGYGLDNHNLGVDGTLNETPFTGNLDGAAGHGLFGGLSLGADIERGPFVFGIFGSYDWSGVKGKASATYDSATVFGAEAKEDGAWLVAGRAGYLFGPKALLYGLAGWENQTVKYTVNNGTLSVDYSGLVIGGGAEYALQNNLFIGIEYQHFFGGKQTLVSGNLSITDDLNTDKIMATLKWKLNSDVFK